VTSPIRSFVVRIYRQGRDGVDGVVEDVRTGKARPFHSIAELWAVLRSPAQRGGPRRDARPEVPPSSAD
jgi:hypothetical protein